MHFQFELLYSSLLPGNIQTFYVEGDLFPSGLAIPNTPLFMINTDNMAISQLKSNCAFRSHERHTKIQHGEDARSL